MISKILSYVLGLLVGLMIIAPPINFSIPLIVNSGGWLYLVLASALFGFYLLFTDLPVVLKIVIVYLFLNCFVSEVPYLSFNAFILVVASGYCFLGFLHSGYKFILKMIVAAFCVELAMLFFQQMGKDTLMNFGHNNVVFFGTVMQYMRLSSLFAIMAPFLVMRSKWFIIPLVLLCLVSQSSSFMLSLVCGILVFLWLKFRQFFWGFLFTLLIFAGYFLYQDPSLYAELHWGRWTVWPEIVKTVVFNTVDGPIRPLSGPVDFKAILFGRGMDTFLPLFPIYKHDPNPFGQAHNDFLQLWWEIGLVGFGLLIGYMGTLLYRVRKFPLLVSGFVCVSVNAFFTMPTRQTQCMLLVICFLAICECVARKGERYDG